MEWLIGWIWPIVAGGTSWWLSNRCRGRNAQKALRYAALGFWMLLLTLINIGFLLPLPLFFLNFVFIKIIPSILLFLAAGNSVLKEMRAQQRGEYTEKAL